MHRLRSLEHLATHPSPFHLLVLAGIVVAAAGVVFLFTRVSPTTTFTLGILAEAFSSNWKHAHVPVPLDRVLFVLGLVILVTGGTRLVFDRRIVLRPIHFLLLAVETYAVCSAIGAGTFGTSLGFYALLDRLGAVPFLMFTLAPLLFGSARQRNRLLVGFVVLGAYLGVTAVFEVVGPHALVFPRYIANQNLGITQGRARGPYLASDADSLILFFCGAMAGVAISVWKGRIVRLACALVLVVDALGIFLTLTRSSWIGAGVALVVVMLVDPRLRKMLVPAVLAIALGISLILTVPSLKAKVNGRVATQSSIWDRYNTDSAALRLLEAHPVFGIGWETFVTQGTDALRQAAGYPLTGMGLEVHDVFLSHLTELGVLGGLLWIVAFLSVLCRGMFLRGPPELYPWRLALVAYGIMFTSVALFVPLSYAQANLCLWLLAGIVSRDYLSVRRPRDEAPPPAAVPEPPALAAPVTPAEDRPLVGASSRV